MNNQRNPNSPQVLSVRPLVRQDLEALRQRSARPTLKALRDSHHAIARLFASGLKLAEIAEQTGYGISRLSILRHDPAMAELIARYRDAEDQSWRNQRDEVHATIHRVMAKAYRQVEEHLDEADESGEKLPLKTLIAVAADGADRVGYVKRTVNINANVDFAKKLEEAIRRTKTIEGKAA